MEIERVDIYDFKVTLNPDEFTSLSVVADKLNFNIELVLSVVVERGLNELIKDFH